MEKILCAAIWFNDGKIYNAQPKNIESGYVLCGYRHNNIISVNMALTGNPCRRETSVQGFLTNLNRFVNRVDANMIAIRAEQVVGNEIGDELISEDLY